MPRAKFDERRPVTGSAKQFIQGQPPLVNRQSCRRRQSLKTKKALFSQRLAICLPTKADYTVNPDSFFRLFLRAIISF